MGRVSQRETDKKAKGLTDTVGNTDGEQDNFISLIYFSKEETKLKL
jgi:hypothetical protein